MLLNSLMPVYDVRERHRIEIEASSAAVYAAVRRMDLSGSWWTRLLFRLRGIPAPAHFTLDNLLRMRFILLAEQPGAELVLGLVGRFWTPTGGLLRLDRQQYAGFAEPGYAKVAWNFRLKASAAQRVRLLTETRVRATDEASRRWFGLYWRLVGPFSALIRREMLHTLKRTAERGLFDALDA